MSKKNNDQNISIHDQIKIAFEAKPNIAGTLHGIRKINQGSVGKRTALFPSRKNGGMIPVESRLELAYALELEKDSGVHSYRSQALKITLNESQSVFPDFLIKFNDKKISIHEVKQNKLFLKLKEQERYEYLEKILNYLDINFKIVDQSKLPSQYEFSKWLYLYQRANIQNWSEFQIQTAIAIIPKHHELTLIEIHKLLKINNLPCELGEYLVFYKDIVLPRGF